MKTAKPAFRSADEVEAVYYEAFRHGDIAVMAALWAEGDVVCVHPGSAAILGHAAVVRSWTHILSQAQMPDIQFAVVKKTQQTGLAVHLVAEEIATANGAATLVLATNVYQEMDGRWLMIEHHASLVNRSARGQALQ